MSYRAVFIDTGWENRDTYEYLRDYLPSVIGPITEIRAVVELPAHIEEVALEMEDRLGFYSPMVRMILKKGMFSGRVRKFCTQSIKIDPLKDYLESLDYEPTSVVGVRAAESSARSKLPEHDYSDFLDVPVWRPLIRWSEQDVIDIHARHGIAPNPGYMKGSTRVGCWPCIYSRKSEIRRLSADPVRVGVIRDLERIVGKRMVERMRSMGKEPTMPAAWFYGKGNRAATPIDQAIAWSNTTHGGRQFELFAPPAREQGCMRWGLCDSGIDNDRG
jgi:3'-phosphoadenosine 5'-phosphosulfate sulfotransferase (PAPS reductase)/FAD synthetase